MSRPVVLIADANTHIRCFLKRELNAEGFDVISAKVHTEVLKQLETADKPDLIVLDSDLPYVGGVSTLLRLRSRAPQIPVVIYTVYSEDAEKPLYAEADAIVEKIPNPALLVRTIRNLLGRRGKSRTETAVISGKPLGSGE